VSETQLLELQRLQRAMHTPALDADQLFAKTVEFGPGGAGQISGACWYVNAEVGTNGLRMHVGRRRCYHHHNRNGSL
jgi:hypothetical protein